MLPAALSGMRCRARAPHAEDSEKREQAATMSSKDAGETANTPRHATRLDASREDPLSDTCQLVAPEAPHGVDRRSFLMRTAVGGAAAVMTGCSPSPAEKT